jgi:hypothetical protein
MQSTALSQAMKPTLTVFTALLLPFTTRAQTPAKTPTAGKKSIVTVSASTPERPRKSEGDVIELKDGRLLLISMEFGGDGNDFAITRLVAHESADGGRTWAGHRLITDTAPGDVNVYSPNLIRAQDGGILLLFMRQHRPGSLTNCPPTIPRRPVTRGRAGSRQLTRSPVCRATGFGPGTRQELKPERSGEVLQRISRIPACRIPNPPPKPLRQHGRMRHPAASCGTRR